MRDRVSPPCLSLSLSLPAGCSMRVREGGAFTTAAVVVVAAAVFTTLELPTTGELTMLSTIHRQSHTHAHAHLHTHTAGSAQ